MNKDITKTGNKKCWHLVNGNGNKVVAPKGMTRNVAEKAARRAQETSDRSWRACLDGYHFVPCTGPAHNNANIDHCMVCAPEWGVVMVPEQYKSLTEYRESRACQTG